MAKIGVIGAGSWGTALALLLHKNGNEVTVNFAEAKFEYDEDRQMRFYVGMEKPEYETLYKAVVISPEYNADFVKSVKYLARPKATYKLTVPVLFQYTVPIINYEIKIGGNEVETDLDDAWLDVGEKIGRAHV